jgi:hypothetical protein
MPRQREYETMTPTGLLTWTSGYAAACATCCALFGNLPGAGACLGSVVIAAGMAWFRSHKRQTT